MEENSVNTKEVVYESFLYQLFGIDYLNKGDEALGNPRAIETIRRIIHICLPKKDCNLEDLTREERDSLLRKIRELNSSSGYKISPGMIYPVNERPQSIRYSHTSRLANLDQLSRVSESYAAG